jgi:hypothetical protein
LVPQAYGVLTNFKTCSVAINLHTQKKLSLLTRATYAQHKEGLTGICAQLFGHDAGTELALVPPQ